MPELSVYLSGPFYTPEQKQTIQWLEVGLSDMGLKIWSPSRDGRRIDYRSLGFQLDEAFGDNYHYLGACDVVVAVLEGWDLGVMWECGVAYERGKVVIGYMDKATPFPTPLLLRAFRSIVAGPSELRAEIRKLAN